MRARTLQNAKECRDKKQGGNGRENQSADDRPAKRSILFTAIAESQSHRAPCR